MNDAVKAALNKVEKVELLKLSGLSVEIFQQLRNEGNAAQTLVNRTLGNFEKRKAELFQRILKFHRIEPKTNKSYNIEYDHETKEMTLWEIQNAMPTEQLPVQEPINENPVQELQPE